MQSLSSRMLASASFAVIATFALASAASAQGTEPPVTNAEAQDCAKLATQPEKDACLQAQAEDKRGVDESGSADTIAPTERAEQKAETENTIVVTGSRLRTAFSKSPDPLMVIDPELSRQQGNVETAEVLQSSPVAQGSTQVTAFLSSNFVFNGGQGVQTLSLRGLGAERTLVLLDGRRAGPSGVRGGVGAFDLNVLPTSIIRSVEIVKTGASSIYGSDAIAGVVNILTKRDTDGIELRAFGSIPEHGGGETYQASATWGKEFDRGHILLTGSWERREALRRKDRDFLDCTIDYSFDDQGQRNDILDPRTGEPACVGNNNSGSIAIVVNNSGVAQNNLGRPPGSASNITTIGLIQFNGPGDQLDLYGFALRPPLGPRSFVAPASFFAVNFNSPSTGVMDFNPEVDRNVTTIPKTTRYTLFGSGSYELSDHVEAFGDLLYSHRETHTDLVRQLAMNQFTSNQGRNDTVPFYCATQVPTTSFGSPNPYCRATDVLGDPINVGFTGAQLIAPIVYVPLTSDIKIDYYRAVGGVRGEVGLFGKPWRWEAWGQYSLSDGDYRQDVIFTDAYDALNFRTRSCVGLTTEIRGTPCIDVNLTDPRILVDGNFTDAERDFLFGSDTGNTKYKQWTGEATISGEVVDLWAGPLQASLGLHIRRDSLKDVPGEITQSGNSWGLTASGVTQGVAVTTEAFGEMSLPLFEDRPIGSAEITGAVRVTNYKADRADGASDKDNGNWTYKLGANWAVTDWLRLRSTYGTSYRAPQLFEQFLADESSFLGQTTIDPCIQWGNALAAGTISQNLADNCAAQGVSPTYNGLNGTAIIFTGGGIGVLDPETSNAFTASVIFTPPPIWEGMRFSLAVDYFAIKVKGEITNLGSRNIVVSCLQSEFFPTDPLCGLFTRINDPTATNQSMITAVHDPFINVDTQLNRGYDFTARLTQDMGSKGNLTILGQATFQVEDAFELFAGAPSNNNGEAGDPKWVGQLDVTWAKKPFTILYSMNYVGATSDRSDIRASLGADLCGTNAFRGTICPDFRLERTFYHHASITFNLMDKFDITAGVRNIFDTPPPRVSRVGQQSGGVTGNGVALLGTQYDYLGRRFFVGLTGRF